MAEELPPSGTQQPGISPQQQTPPQQQPPSPEQQSFRKQYDEPPFQRVGTNRGIFETPMGQEKGMLVVFKYDFWKHDPYPLVLVTSIYRDKQMLAGVNLHRLTYLDVERLLKSYCNKKTFSYQSGVKGDMYAKKAFRTYKKAGMRSERILDCEFVMNSMGIIRKSYDPNEVNKIRQHIQQTLRQKVNPRADDLITPIKGQVGQTPIQGQPASIPAQPASIPANQPQ